MSACVAEVVNVLPNSREWKEARKKYLGASDVAAVLGLSKWTTAAEVAGAKLGTFEKEMSADMARGHALEILVAAAWEEETGRKTVAGRMYVHPVHKWASCTTDRDDYMTGEPLEVKTVNDRAFASGEWGQDGSDEIPEYYLCQCMWQLAITGHEKMDLVALAAPRESMAILARLADTGADKRMLLSIIKEIGIHLFTIHRNDALIADMFEACGEFWQAHVVERQPVPEYGRMIDNGQTIQATADDEDLLVQLQALYVGQKRGEAKLEEVEAKVKARIGEASAISGKVGTVTWKKAKDSVATVTDWEAVAKKLGDLLGKPHVYESVVKSQTGEKVKPGARRFVVPRSWSKEA